jgi:hypothetical protein
MDARRVVVKLSHVNSRRIKICVDSRRNVEIHVGLRRNIEQ